jgi:hypothetical protein
MVQIFDSQRQTAGDDEEDVLIRTSNSYRLDIEQESSENEDINSSSDDNDLI